MTPGPRPRGRHGAHGDVIQHGEGRCKGAGVDRDPLRPRHPPWSPSAAPSASGRELCWAVGRAADRTRQRVEDPRRGQGCLCRATASPSGPPAGRLPRPPRPWAGGLLRRPSPRRQCPGAAAANDPDPGLRQQVFVARKSETKASVGSAALRGSEGDSAPGSSRSFRRPPTVPAVPGLGGASRSWPSSPPGCQPSASLSLSLSQRTPVTGLRAHARSRTIPSQDPPINHICKGLSSQ